MAAFIGGSRSFLFRTKCTPYNIGSHILPLRNTSTITVNNLKYCQLDKRRLLRVNGTDSVKLLQGLVTNNVELFHQDTTLKTMYCMILNAQGRVLYDTILYKDKPSSQTPSFLVECDKSAINVLAKLLKMYKLRSQVDITPVEDVDLWAVFSDDLIDSAIPDIKSDGVISVGKDPRTKELGWRVLLSQGVSPSELLQGVIESDQGAYDVHRIKLGVSEGMDEIKSGVALPLEHNLDYMNGVSFQKGCYIGQELTARTHHTGVIRKRIMPFTHNSPQSIIKLEHGTPIKTSSSKTSGKLCVVYGQYGLAVMRMTMMGKDKHFVQDNEGHDIEVCPYVPKWWPTEEQGTSG